MRSWWEATPWRSTFPLSTKDIDLLLAGNDDNLRRASEALRRFGAPEVVVRGVATLAASEIVYFGQPPLRVDFLRSMITNKEASGRPQDLVDATYLKRVRDA